MGHVVDEYVLAQALRRRIEDAPLVEPRHLAHKLLQVVVVVEHEGVDDDALVGAALHLF